LSCIGGNTYDCASFAACAVKIVLHQAIGQDRIVVQDRAAIVAPGDVLRAIDSHDAGRCQNKAQIDLDDARMGLGR
jgi:hypothetical protein